MSILNLLEFCLFILKEGEVKITEEVRPYTKENQACFLRINCFESQCQYYIGRDKFG